MASYPWKYQLLLTIDGKLVKILSGQRFDFVTIIPNQNPFLLLVTATARGNGGHEIYKITADTLENIYEGYYDCNLSTFDAHQDRAIYEPNELNLKFIDKNKDRFEDIVFYGQRILLQSQTKQGIWYDVKLRDGKEIYYNIDNPAKKIPVEFIFYYDKQTGHFRAKENYTKKYGLNE